MAVLEYIESSRAGAFFFYAYMQCGHLYAGGPELSAEENSPAKVE
jgi:hypothetical protein